MIPKYTIFVLAILCSCCGCKHKVEYKTIEPHKHYKVILMVGQSNMVGKGKLSDIDYLKFNNIVYYDFGLTTNLKPSKKKFGPEVGLSCVLSERYPDGNFILLKYAINGASLWNFSPDYLPEKAELTGHLEFGDMYKTFLKKVENTLNGIDSEIIALLWMQGEADARINKAGEEYYDNFKALINNLRDDLKTPYLPIIYGMINPPATDYPMINYVRNAQARIKQDLPNTYLINTDSIDKWEDDIHYSSTGQLDLGKKFGYQIANIIDN